MLVRDQTFCVDVFEVEEVVVAAEELTAVVDDVDDSILGLSKNSNNVLKYIIGKVYMKLLFIRHSLSRTVEQVVVLRSLS